MVSTDKARPDTWKTKEIIAVIQKLKNKGRPVIVRTKNDTHFFHAKGWDLERIMKDVKTVLDRRTDGSTNLHNRS
jgi:hypothetical protein